MYHWNFGLSSHQSIVDGCTNAVPLPGDDVYFPISSMAHAKAPAAPPAPTTATPAAQSTAAQGKDCGSTGLFRMLGMLVLEVEMTTGMSKKLSDDQ